MWDSSSDEGNVEYKQHCVKNTVPPTKRPFQGRRHTSIILKRILKKYSMSVWAGFVWFGSERPAADCSLIMVLVILQWRGT
jgi:hypothetical protein